MTFLFPPKAESRKPSSSPPPKAGAPRAFRGDGVEPESRKPTSGSQSTPAASERSLSTEDDPDDERPTTPPESPSATERRIHWLRRSEIRDNNQNYRERLPRIAELAESISQHGLLENLVARILPDYERATADAIEWVELKAGSRRLAAIDVLIEDGRWPAERLIPVLLLGTDGFWENLSENLQRVDAEPWEIGRRLNEAASAGLNYREISARIAKSPGYVTRHIAIGTGIAPETIAYLREKKLTLPLLRLQQLASLRNRFNEPDGEAQIANIERYRMRPGRRRQRPVADSVHAFAQRLAHLRNEMPVPRLIRPIVEAILLYVEEGQRPNFKALHRELLGERIRVYGEGPEPDPASE